MPTDASKRVLSDSEHDLDEHIRAERIRYIFIQSLLPIVFSPLAGLILAYTLRDVVGTTRLATFVLGLVAIAVVRVVTIRSFPKEMPKGPALHRWERIFVFTILLVGLWWGVGALFLLTPGATRENALLFCFVMLMAGGHAASYSAHRGVVSTGVTCIVLPITVVFAFRGDAFHWTLAFIALMFLVAMFRNIGTLSYFFGRTYRLAYELERERDRVAHLARYDALTGLNNRRAFYEFGEPAVAKHAAAGQPLSLAMMDIDHFKSINDKYGHACGDEAIRTASAMIEGAMSGDDLPGRLGGEEFGALLHGVTLDEAYAKMRGFIEQVAAKRFRFEDLELGFTMSCGVAQLAPGETLDQLVARADLALYQAKRGGRNRVVKAGPAAAA
jgi:diguanylate cyclase (GGDEF)-like protein